MKKILFLIVALSATLNMSANAPAVSVGAAKPVVLVDEPTAKDWYDRLGQTIMTVEANVNKLSESEAKKQLKTALSNANDLFMPDYDSEKSEEYKTAYNTLWGAYQDAIKVDVDAQVSVLGSAIEDAEKNIMPNVLVGEFYKTELQGLIDNAGEVKENYSKRDPYAIGDISFMQGYIQQFNSDVQSIIVADIAAERGFLDSAIGIAETRLLGIQAESSKIAEVLGDAISAATTVAEDPTATAHQLSDEYTDICKADEKCNNDFELFKAAKKDLDDAIKAANAFCVTIKHTPISSILFQSITIAQGVYDGAINKTKKELDTEKDNVVAAQTAASEAEAVAVEIDVWIANASHAKSSIADEEIKEQIQAAIDEARTALNTKSAIGDLEAALTTLKNKTKDYVNADIDAACADLKEQIVDADDKLENVIAYDEFYSQLYDARVVAYDVYKKLNHTAEEIIEATATLSSAIEGNVEADGLKAVSELTNKLEGASTKLSTVNAVNTTLAGDLATKIEKATPLLSDGTAKTRKAAADALTLAIQAADNAYNMFIANKAALEVEKLAAETTKETIAVNHAGIKAALTSAINAAGEVLEADTIKTKTNAEISQELVALKNAHQGAKDAEQQALQLDDVISDAENALVTIKDPTAKSGLQTAIDYAKAQFDEPSNTSSAYFNARNVLYNAITSYVKDDIAKGRAALGQAICSAGTALTDTLVNEPYITNVTDAKLAAVTVKENDEADRATLDTARGILLGIVRDAVAGDLAAEKEILGAKVNGAKTTLKPYQDIAKKIKNSSAKTAFNTAVVNPFNTIITAANKVYNNAKSTSKQMDAQVTNLTNGETEMVKAYDNLYESEKQNFVTTYLREKALAANVNKVNNVIVGLHNSAWLKGIDLNEKLNGENPEECTYPEIINVRIPMDDECYALEIEFSQWQTDCIKLATLKDDAQKWNENLKEEDPEAPIRTTLQDAIDAAGEIVVADKNATQMEAAYTELETALNEAKAAYNTQYWDFSDGNSEFKAGNYAAEHARYTRTIAAEGNFGTFVLPMEIIVDATLFTHAYKFEPFAIHNGTTLKLFLTEYKPGTKIPAGTAFFAQLAKEGKLVLKNNSALNFIINEAGKPINTTTSKEIKAGSTTISVFEQTGNSSFLEKSVVTYTWTGTFQMITDLTKKFVYKNSAGKFLAPDDYIDPFRGYLIQKNDFPSNAKSVEAIEFDFGDDSETTGIRSIMMGSSDGSQIFSIDGKNMGNDMNSLNKGVYIINGKKVLK